MKLSLRKSSYQRTLTGTLGGLSEYFGIDYAWARVIFVILVLLTEGWLILLYLFLVLIIPGAQIPDLVGRDMGRYFKGFWLHLKSVLLDSRFSKLFGLSFLGLGIAWAATPLRVLPAVLLVLGAVLFFDPFGLSPARAGGAQAGLTGRPLFQSYKEGSDLWGASRSDPDSFFPRPN